MYWWETDEYDIAVPIPAGFEELAGPWGIAVVKAHEDGSTTPGWGMTPDKRGNSFITNYAANRFNDQIARVGWISGRWNFAFVMRSMALVCIDIDGKNGGLQNIGKLGMLPPTLAETSKSGDGYHLFYSTPSDVWDHNKGFAMFKDRIGIVPGVDIRAVGCVYHFSTQLWNGRGIVPLPLFQRDAWLARAAKTEQEVDEIIELIDADDEDELNVVRNSLLSDLKRPVPQGKRNTTLYAIGVKMLLAQVPDWKAHLYKRSIALGLDSDESKKIVSNVEKYR